MFAAVWAAAVLGIILNAVDMEKFKVVSMICYLVMGWVVVLAFNTVAAKMPGVGLNCLIAGGVAYTVGAVLYGLGKKVPYMHAVWHLFVLAGSVLHTLSVFTVII